MVKIVLFDLDGTLVDMFNLHFKAELKCYKTFFGINLDRNVWESKMGMTEEKFTREILKGQKSKAAFETKKFQLLLKHKKKILMAILNKTKVKIFPGIKKALRELKKRKVYACMITGNHSLIGRLIIKNSGMEKYFDVRVYADHINSRTELVSKAVKQLGNMHKIKIKMRDVLVVGDSIHDIKSGKKLGCKTLAVATGVTAKETLAKESPDYLLDNLKNTEEFLSIL